MANPIINNVEAVKPPQNDDQSIIVWADGCYDGSHFGHANSLRQAKALGDKLIVGVHSDEEINKNKGTPPVFTEEERYALVRAMKWVDEVVEGAPYVTTIETLKQHNCNFCAHGNDTTTTLDGADTYQMVKDAGKYKEVERSQGISTTELIKRMLKVVQLEDDCSRKKNTDTNNNPLDENCLTITESLENTENQIIPTSSPWTGSSTPLLLTSRKLSQFRTREPTPSDKIVYVAGVFDLFHLGHLKFLEQAASLGTYLIIGLHSDELVTSQSYPNYPNNYTIMTLNERAYNVLGYKYVQEIVLGAPLHVTDELLKHFNISVVVHGKTGHFSDSQDDLIYAEPRQKGILQEVDSGSQLTASHILDRVRVRRSEYEERNRKKEQKEVDIIAAE